MIGFGVELQNLFYKQKSSKPFRPAAFFY